MSYFVSNGTPLKSFKHEINKMKSAFEVVHSGSWMKSGWLAGRKSKRSVDLEVMGKYRREKQKQKQRPKFATVAMGLEREDVREFIESLYILLLPNKFFPFTLSSH